VQTERSGGLTAKTLRGFSPGAWGSPQQAASVREWNARKIALLAILAFPPKKARF